MFLRDLVERLHELEQLQTIYARKPWTPESEAILTPADGGLAKTETEYPGYSYFLEVFVAVEFLDGWRSSLELKPSLDQACIRLIQYAINDA
jgi:hypothetical protein